MKTTIDKERTTVDNQNELCQDEIDALQSAACELRNEASIYGWTDERRRLMNIYKASCKSHDLRDPEYDH